jgi:hypothetical protein
MALPNIFSQTICDEMISRINKLEADTPAKWGKMTAPQMLAHCNVTYEMVYEDKHPKPNFIMRFILKSFVKNMVVSEKPYKRNLQTAPAFLITDSRDFDVEQKRLIEYLNKTRQLGAESFDNKASHSFGKLSIEEWNNMFYKHLDHHLTQFGV